MRSKKGVRNVRKLPSQRIVENPHVKLSLLFTEIGHPCPIVPKSYKNRPDDYWKIMNEKVENGLKLIKVLNEALDEIERTSPEFAMKLPWYQTRKKWKENGAVINEDHLRIELLSFYQKNFLNSCSKAQLYRLPSRDANDREEIKLGMRKLHAKRKMEIKKAG